MSNQAIAKEMEDRLNFHITETRKQSRFYFRTARFFQWGIPVLSALSTVGASGEFSWLAPASAWIAALVTILTVLHSAVHPSSRYASSVEFSNQFNGFRTGLSLAIEAIELDPAITNKELALNHLLAGKNQELVRLIDAFNKAGDKVADKGK